MRRRLVIWAPLAIFLAFVLTVGISLYAPSDRIIRSRMVGQPVPAFALPPALPGRPGLGSADLATGRPRIVNVFASWCPPCITEAPQLLALAQRGVAIDAIAVRDRPDDLAAFLARWGDPYQRIGNDRDSRVQMALGSAGVPETFVIDGKGIVRHQHVGDIRPEHMAGIIAAYEAAR